MLGRGALSSSGPHVLGSDLTIRAVRLARALTVQRAPLNWTHVYNLAIIPKLCRCVNMESCRCVDMKSCQCVVACEAVFAGAHLYILVKGRILPTEVVTRRLRVSEVYIIVLMLHIFWCSP